MATYQKLLITFKKFTKVQNFAKSGHTEFAKFFKHFVKEFEIPPNFKRKKYSDIFKQNHTLKFDWWVN